jgi:hypothetical protein
MQTSVLCPCTANKDTDSTHPRELAGVAGMSGNRILLRVAATMTLALSAPESVSDLDYGVPCGECKNANGEPQQATFTIEWTGTDLNGDDAPRREHFCDGCVADGLRYAERMNQRAFVPAVVSSVPACQFCGAEFHACTTNFRGLCVQMPVSA